MRFQVGDKVRPSDYFIRKPHLKDEWIDLDGIYEIEAVADVPENSITAAGHTQHVTIKEDEGIYRNFKWSGAFWTLVWRENPQ